MSNNRSFAERAARLRAAWYRYKASVVDVEASAIRMTDAMRRFADAVQSGTDREIAEHPDLAEINVMLDGYYENPKTQ
ncbi:hypothetical protein ACIRJ3_04025 [Streptomyces anulatus]